MMTMSKKRIAGVVAACGLVFAAANVAAHPGAQGGGMGPGAMRGMGHGMMAQGTQGQDAARTEANQAGCAGMGPGAMQGQHGRMGQNAGAHAQGGGRHAH